MDLKMVAAAALGCSFGLMFKSVVDAVESYYRMKMMMQNAVEYAQNNEEKKTQK